jgi:hypothetical protein
VTLPTVVPATNHASFDCTRCLRCGALRERKDKRSRGEEHAFPADTTHHEFLPLRVAVPAFGNESMPRPRAMASAQRITIGQRSTRIEGATFAPTRQPSPEPKTHTTPSDSSRRSCLSCFAPLPWRDKRRHYAAASCALSITCRPVTPGVRPAVPRLQPAPANHRDHASSLLLCRDRGQSGLDAFSSADSTSRRGLDGSLWLSRNRSSIRFGCPGRTFPAEKQGLLDFPVFRIRVRPQFSSADD